MKTKLISLALGLVALTFTGAAVIPARADHNGNGNDNDIDDEGIFELIELDSRRDVVVVRCDERLIQAELVSEGLKHRRW